MSKEENVRTALADLEAEVVAGADMSEIIPAIARENDLKPEVLEARVVRAYGELATFEAKCASKRIALLNRAHEFESIERVIDEAPLGQLTSKIPQLSPWWKTIHRDYGASDEKRTAAFQYARILIRRKQLQQSFGAN